MFEQDGITYTHTVNNTVQYYSTSTNHGAVRGRSIAVLTSRLFSDLELFPPGYFRWRGRLTGQARCEEAPPVYGFDHHCASSGSVGPTAVSVTH